MNRKPLITFVLFGYNQEGFIREALDGAFSQTYSPLEIILSDDCSSDRTFEIMTETAKNYTGPHKVVLNRNSSNFGIGAHINRVMELANGELIVVAAGDDISVPERVEYIYKVYESSNRKAKSIFSKFIAIDQEGNNLNYQQDRMYQYANYGIENLVMQDHILSGCSHAWDRELFDIYGPLIIPLTCEDMVIPIRSSLLGEIRYIEEALVRYRVHDKNTWSYKIFRDADRDIKFQIFWQKEQKSILINWVNDILRTKEIEPSRKEEMDKLLVVVKKRLKSIEDDIILLNGSWNEKMTILFKNMVNGIGYKKLISKIGFYLFPRVYRKYLQIKYHIKSK